MNIALLEKEQNNLKTMEAYLLIKII